MLSNAIESLEVKGILIKKRDLRNIKSTECKYNCY